MVIIRTGEYYSAGCHLPKNSTTRSSEMDTASRATSPLEVFREWQRCLAANDQAGAAKVVDVDGYTEICLGLTQWTTGYQVAAENFYRNMVAPWSEMTFSIEDLTESDA